MADVAVRHEPGWEIRLLGGFELRGPLGIVEVTPGVQRLLAYIVLQGGAVGRAVAARVLWPDVTPGQSAASLRSALWRTRRVGPLVQAGHTTLRLEPQVLVDVADLEVSPARGASGPSGRPRKAFALELLPDWSDEWVDLERERLRHLELSFLDEEVESLLRHGRVVEALDTALRAIRLEPLREASHQALIRIFLLTGNRSAALMHYRALVRTLREELDLGPDPSTTALVQPFLPPRRDDPRPRERRLAAGHIRGAGRR